MVINQKPNKFHLMKKLFFLSLLSLSVSSVWAANVMLTVHLKNGDIISGKSTLNKIAITTAYGNLTIPIDQISALQFGIPSDHSKDAAVVADLTKLNAAKGLDAKTIYDKLLAMGTPVLSTVKTFSESTNYSISENENYTIEQLLDELYKIANLSSADPIEDAITFGNNNYIEGNITFSDILLQSDYGNLTFKKDKIESLDISMIDESTILGNGQFRLKANTQISGNEKQGWVNTGISLKEGDKFTITASGKIILKSLSGGAFNPDGYVSGTKDGAYNEDAEIKYGSVVYKIGENGTYLGAGSKFEGVAESSGPLFISIYETVYDKSNTGSYTVTVKKK